MSDAPSSASFLEEGFRWFGPGDPVPLVYIRQAGATAVFTSLHQIPYGEMWSRQSIQHRKEMLAAAGLRWAVVESVPVHESIKTGRGDLKHLLNNYQQTLRHLAEEGIETVVYNFMPVLDWVRTDMHYRLPDGAEALRFDPVHFAAFDLFALQRRGAENDHSPEHRELAAAWWKGLAEPQRETFIKSIIDVFPGCKWGLSLHDICEMLARYHGIDRAALTANLARFLEAVVPVAEQVGVRLAIHPDDPPFPVLGLPRIVSTAADVEQIFNLAPSPANGLCYCTGSFSARADNDLPAMVRQFAPRIHAAHLRSTHRLPDGSFYEAAHLGGSVDMPAVLRALLAEQDRRQQEGRADWQITLRPDHGHVMMDDLAKPDGITPGYSAIGRMRGLAELRGLMMGLRYAGH
ncbi:MAG: mannonate dehydratase [Chthoniobacteraceae bacterium]